MLLKFMFMKLFIGSDNEFPISILIFLSQSERTTVFCCCCLHQTNLIGTYVSFIPFFVFGFWSLLATKLQKYYIIFARQSGQDGKNGKKITQLMRPKDENMG